MAIIHDRLTPPLADKSLVAAMRRVWENEFGHSFEYFAEILQGSEPQNHVVLRLARSADAIAGTCQVTTSGDEPRIGGVGEVVVPNEFRGQGIASRLFRESCDEFFSSGGQALFLGTENPAAARIYHRYGFRRVAGTQNMVCVASGTPEEFLHHHYQQSRAEPFEVIPFAASLRMQVVPFLMAPHEMMVLDRHTGYVSIRHHTLHGCMSLFGRFASVHQEGQVCAAVTKSQAIRAFATARVASEVAQLDAFALPGDFDAWQGVLSWMRSWAADKGLRPEFLVAVEDDVKRDWLEQSGVRFEPSAKTLTVGSRELRCLVGHM